MKVYTNIKSFVEHKYKIEKESQLYSKGESSSKIFDFQICNFIESILMRKVFNEINFLKGEGSDGYH